MKIRDIEISRLKSKLNYLNPQNNDVSLEKIINSGKESINILKEKLTQTENEVKQELEKVLKDNKKYENEIMGLKRIINKLTDKIKTLKNE
ncbi:hypothetical protein NBO_53g0031 [Nosema bombycis CQ1]|uniref:Uncharacterized protein n=1 Tax=Nosema bombycis (strain CQ1 / CVCC 102059) TaxID=578461 RepID=R0KUN5_NOSB1|nr:hypothetical protein NBO_53g0031 [Nosema bombycis CQ1]|eukprot:EOB13907.1 hypothetical protein NBO_53g0031 [Nosema bombycis CQ1]